MYADLPYGERFVACYRSDNKVSFRLAISVAEYEGPAVELIGVGSVALRRSVGASGLAGSLAPYRPTELRAQLPPLPWDRRDGTADLTALGGLPDGAVRVELRADLNGDAPTHRHLPDPGPGPYEIGVFSGYLLPETLTDIPGDPLSMVELQAADGLHLAVRRAITDPAAEGWDAATERTLVDWLRSVLRPLGSATASPGALVTSADWRPWIPEDEILAAVDPLAALRVRAEAFVNENQEATQQTTAVRAICGRMLARLEQAAGVGTVGSPGAPVWMLTQRGYLARTAGRDVARWAYPLYSTVGGDPPTADAGPGTRSVATRVRDTIGMERGLDGGVLARVPRSRGLGAEQAESLYAFRPALENAVFNGSFETAGASAAVAASWVHTEGPAAAAERVELDTEFALWEDQYGIRLARDFPAPSVEQANLVFLATATDFVADFSFWYTHLSDVSLLSPGPTYRVVVGDYRIGGTGITVAGEVLASARVIPIAPWLPAGGVVGTPLVAAGTALRIFTGGTTVDVDLAEDLKVGDTKLQVRETSAVIADGATSAAPHFVPDDDLAVEFGAPSSAEGALTRRRCYFRAPDGSPVHGYVSVRFAGANFDEYPDPGDTPSSVAHVDDVTFTVVTSGGSASTFGRRALLPAGTGGAAAVSLPVAEPGGHVLGDGPLPDTATRLRVSADAGVTVYDTQQGADTGWVRGAYAAEAPSSAVVLDELAAREALAQLAGRASEPGGPERWRGGLLLPTAPADDEDRLWWPADPYRLYQPCQIAEPATAGAGYVVLTAPPKPGEPIIVGYKSASVLGVGGEETHYAGAVTAGVGSYTATLVDAEGAPAVLANSHPRHTECRYAMVATADTDDWDTGSNRVTMDAADLAWRDEASFITEITLSS